MKESAPPTNPVTGDAVRAAMRRVPSVVTVVTVGGDEPRGITIGSFVTVSLDPPMVTFNVQHQARMHDRLLEADRFAVHVLAAGQDVESEVFADPDLSGREQLDRVPNRPDEHGIPDLPDCLIRFECSLADHHPAGDHTIMVGRVERLSHRREGHALLYFDRDYRSLETGTTN